MANKNLFIPLNKAHSNKCPISYQNRIWIEKSFSTLLELFGEEKVKRAKVLIPDYSNFPIKYNGEVQTAFKTLKIIAEKMEVEFHEIQLVLYDEDVKKISIGTTGLGHTFLNSIDNEKGSAGLYWGRQPDNKYHIGLERRNLIQPEIMIATLAHEIAHIKLLGENKIQINDEKLTDLTTVIFGLGIFNANAAFQTIKGLNSIGWRKMGYLSENEWGYALSIFAFIRGESTPYWVEHLAFNIKAGFNQGKRYIEDKDLVLSSVKNPIS